MPVINTNVNSIVSQNATNRSDRAITDTMEKLSTDIELINLVMTLLVLQFQLNDFAN